ncbi:MAG: hypothetical protein P8X55_07840, partial [Desulfosarcinaceae bacterium]
MMLVFQLGADGFKQGAHGKGQATAVFDQGLDVGGDQVENRFTRLALEIDRRLVGRHQQVEAGHMYEGVAQGARHVGIDFTHHAGGLFHGQAGHVHGDAQAAVAVPVRRRNLHDDHVHPHFSFFQKVGDARQVAG